MCIDFVTSKVSGKDLGKGLVYFGECMIPHQIEYRWDETPAFIGYDVFNENTGRFLANPEDYFEALDLPFAPVVSRYRSSALKSIDESRIPQSAYADWQAEGIVFKNYRHQEFFKFVGRDFREKTSKPKNFTLNLYLTKARVTKMIWKLVDEGRRWVWA